LRLEVNLRIITNLGKIGIKIEEKEEEQRRTCSRARSGLIRCDLIEEGRKEKESINNDSVLICISFVKQRGRTSLCN